MAIERIGSLDDLPTSDRQAAQMLIGASFSLWRAVFLLDAERAEANIASHGTSFLRKFIQDNAITYQNDRDMRAWSVGYYLNNAGYRAREIATYEGYEDTLQTGDLSEFITDIPGEDIWDQCFAVIRKQLSQLASRCGLERR